MLATYKLHFKLEHSDTRWRALPRVSLLALALLALTSVVSSQTGTRSSQKSNKNEKVLVSRSVSRSDEDAPHARKGKKGFVASAKRTEPTTSASAKRTEPTTSAAAKRAASTTTASAKRTGPTTKAAAKGTEATTLAARSRTSTPSTQVATKTATLPVSPAKVEIPVPTYKTENPRTEESIPPPILAVSDRIEVIEWGVKPAIRSTPLSLPTPVPLKPIVSSRRYEVEIDPTRVLQIQQALISRGFLAGEPTSVYDEATIEAMRLFQISQKIDSTGYPTAHALKRLGL